MAYCRWLSDKTGRRYRLPGEAEWEKAASWDEEGNKEPRRGSRAKMNRSGNIRGATCSMRRSATQRSLASARQPRWARIRP